MSLRKLSSPHVKFIVHSIIHGTLFDAEMGRYDNPIPQQSQFQLSPAIYTSSPTSSLNYQRFQSPISYNSSWPQKNPLPSPNDPVTYQSFKHSSLPAPNTSSPSISPSPSVQSELNPLSHTSSQASTPCGSDSNWENYEEVDKILCEL